MTAYFIFITGLEPVPPIIKTVSQPLDQMNLNSLESDIKKNLSNNKLNTLF